MHPGSRAASLPVVLAALGLLATTRPASADRAVDVPGRPPGVLSFLRPNPSPARRSLTLRFALQRQTRTMRLTIYDVTGRRVRELASGARPAGEHAIAWDFRDESGQAVRAGFYFAHLEADGGSLTRKFAKLE